MCPGRAPAGARLFFLAYGSSTYLHRYLLSPDGNGLGWIWARRSGHGHPRACSCGVSLGWRARTSTVPHLHLKFFFYPAHFAPVPSHCTSTSTPPSTSQTFPFGSPVSIILCTEAHHRYLPCPALPATLHGSASRARNIAVGSLSTLDAKSVRQARRC